MVDGRWSMVDGRWSMVDGRWSMVDGRWSHAFHGSAQDQKVPGSGAAYCCIRREGAPPTAWAPPCRRSWEGRPRREAFKAPPNIYRRTTWPPTATAYARAERLYRSCL
ncbi:hypothetical protein CXK93_03135 [Stutzerimonas decontaminans]|uniref:Uncharacterized protein n=1 Tax=Stutzerimonas decontaminans TaxID=3022791 RepID=A0ABX4W0U4_9GAMM|nr:hypothetical protein CXK93_03135 [Stutzerimonas decontaminans]